MIIITSLAPALGIFLLIMIVLHIALRNRKACWLRCAEIALIIPALYTVAVAVINWNTSETGAWDSIGMGIVLVSWLAFFVIGAVIGLIYSALRKKQN